MTTSKHQADTVYLQPVMAYKGWQRLPAEMRCRIYDFMKPQAYEKQLPSTDGSEHHRHQIYPLAAYASVCREWKYVFEPLNFKRLTLSNNDLGVFDRLVQDHRRKLVKHIWFRIELPSATKPQPRADSVVYTEALYSLLNILSRWGKKGQYKAGERGIGLELSVHRADDPKDLPEYLGTLRPIYPATLQAFPDLTAQYNPIGLDVAWLKKRTNRELRLLPAAPAIHSLVIRREFLRQLTPGSNMMEIIKALPRLQCFRHEKWHKIGQGQGEDHDFDRLYRQVINTRKRHLKKVVIVEQVLPSETPDMSAWDDRIDLSIFAKSASRSLEELHLALPGDAEKFLQNFWPGGEPQSYAEDRRRNWSELRYFSLMTQREAFQNRHNLHRGDMFRAAAAAALKMPELEAMEIWSTMGVFRYERRRGNRPLIFLASSHSVCATLGPDVTEAWVQVAKAHGGDEMAAQSSLTGLEIQYATMQDDETTVWVKLLPWLKLKDRWLNTDGGCLGQVNCEGSFRE